MNELEKYHDSGLIEILRTQTLTREFENTPNYLEKAKKYRVIGGSDHPDSYFGAVPGGSSKYYRYYQQIFSTRMDKESEKRAVRDCLHIDQAILNNCNFFVTQEKRLIEAGVQIEEIGGSLEILDPDSCVTKVNSYFQINYGTCDFQYLVNEFNSRGPIFLGSNSAGSISFIDPESNDVIFSCWPEEGFLILECQTWDDDQQLVLKLTKEERARIERRGIYIKASGGKGPIKVGHKEFSQIYIGTDSCPYIAARTLSSGKVLFDRIDLRSRDGKKRIVVDGESLCIEGLIMKCN